MKTLVTVTADGQLELPEPAREELGVLDGGSVELEIVNQTVLLRSVGDDVPTDEELARIRRGLADIEAGRVRDVTEEELLALINPIDRP